MRLQVSSMPSCCNKELFTIPSPNMTLQKLDGTCAISNVLLTTNSYNTGINSSTTINSDPSATFNSPVTIEQHRNTDNLWNFVTLTKLILNNELWFYICSSTTMFGPVFTVIYTRLILSNMWYTLTWLILSNVLRFYICLWYFQWLSIIYK